MNRWELTSKGWQNDGHPHLRDENGFCTTCGAVKGEYHYRCVPKTEQEETP